MRHEHRHAEDADPDRREVTTRSPDLGDTRRMTRRAPVPAIVPAIVLVTALILAVATLVSPPTGGAAAASERQAPGKRVIRFGQVGKAKAGMTVAQGAATGELRKDAPGYCEDTTVPLRPKKPYGNQYVVFVVDGRIVEMAVAGGRPRTVDGLGIDSLNSQVKKAYGKRLGKPVEAGFGQWARYVSRGKGANRTWIGFLFGQTFVDGGPLQPSDKVTLVGVSKGAKPALIIDGC